MTMLPSEPARPLPKARNSSDAALIKKAAVAGRPGGREIELDFLRGLAILLVLDYHAPVHWMSKPFALLGFPNFGWAGVDLFFVLSGFLVGGLLIKEWRTQGTIDNRRFLVRRGFKIWPQYYVFLVLMVLSGHRTLHELRGNLLNLQNYLGGVPHTWSLAVEEHAYLLLAFGLAWAARAKVRMRTPVWILSLLCVVVVVGRLWLTHLGYNVVTATHTRVEGILYGVLLAIVFHHRPDTFEALQRRRGLWLALLVGALLYLRWQPATGWGASLGWDAANLLGIALLMLLYRSRRGAPVGWWYRGIAAIGVYSYGIYLWHVAVIAPSLSLAARLPSKLVPTGRAVLPIAAGIGLGMAFTKLVEFPALQLRDRLFPRKVDTPVGQPAEPERLDRSSGAGAALSKGSTQAVTQGMGI